MVDLQVWPDRTTVTRQAAFRFLNAYEASAATEGHFAVALSGGSTPEGLYRLLSTDEFADQIDWGLVHVFWGDERCVPPEDDDSNYHMARRTLLDFVPIPIGNIHRMQGELDPAVAASAYDARLRDFFHGRVQTSPLEPRFDLVLLGLGPDGHTASLFPNTDVLDETERWAVANYVERLDSWRVTLTPRALNAAARVLFVVTGEDKADALRAVLRGPRDTRRWPAQLIAPEDGALTWLADEAAASRLTRD